MKHGTVVCSSRHVEELDDGTWVHPGQTVTDVDLDSDHIKARVADRAFTVVHEHQPAEVKHTAAKTAKEGAE